MSKLHTTSLFIFRRDLRLEDNTGLMQALEESERVIPLFIFDTAQTDTAKNKYFSSHAFQFMLQSLTELDEALRAHGSKLYMYEGTYTEVLEDICTHNKIDAIYVNRDYIPFSRKRDAAIEVVAKKHGAAFIRAADYVLSPVEEVRTGAGKPYSVFTPFMRQAVTFGVAAPRQNRYKNYFSGSLHMSKHTPTHYKVKPTPTAFLCGGRHEALKLLKRGTFLKRYTAQRNVPAIDGTSRLSAHLKFGTVSVREVYAVAVEEAGATSQFVAELYWRDFYMHIGYHFPHVFGKSFQSWGDHIEWENSKKQFAAWCEGKTGVPIVDAGMRQLNQTGWMHNRVRMIVASYLTKNLLIDWRWGERYFASQLIDYDPCSNNGGWQWSASVGADPKPIRIFNPYLQAQTYDPDATYVKQWVAELEDVDAGLIAGGKEVDFSTLVDGYPSPLISQKESAARARAVYAAAKRHA
ncbi:MAG: Deoxyribodipyrimidine photo-lyase [Candidatus Parcubacteria bacterium]|jgi:deoxyribodipyrimidine photo-lyase